MSFISLNFRLNSSIFPVIIFSHFQKYTTTKYTIYTILIPKKYTICNISNSIQFVIEYFWQIFYRHIENKIFYSHPLRSISANVFYGRPFNEDVNLLNNFDSFDSKLPLLSFDSILSRLAHHYFYVFSDSDRSLISCGFPCLYLDVCFTTY